MQAGGVRKGGCRRQGLCTQHVLMFASTVSHWPAQGLGARWGVESTKAYETDTEEEMFSEEQVWWFWGCLARVPPGNLKVN